MELCSIFGLHLYVFSSVEEQSCVRQKGILISEGRVWTVICIGGETISKKKKTSVRKDETEKPLMFMAFGDATPPSQCENTDIERSSNASISLEEKKCSLISLCSHAQ